jgi:hypothetical protein
MPPNSPNLDQLQQVHELNRLFLTYLQSRALEGRDCLGMPEGARSLLVRASADLLAMIGEFPRALFDIELDGHRCAPARDPLRSRDESMRHALYLMIALCARTLSRQSAYQAGLLLGLESRAIQRLRAMQLSELQPLSHLPNFVQCAFRERDWLWTGLLLDTRPEARRRLALIALQPGVARDWPARRTKQFSP